MARRSTLLYLVAILAAELSTAASRAVNISNTWFLPQEGFPVFYRYFRDRITWFEADAVCQFHHANLVTVDSSKQYDTTRAYLKELDVVTNVWIGLKKKGPNDEFAWTDYKTLAQDGGYWQEQIPKSEAALCAAIDPAADFRWHSLNCGGPETASFICELPVPPWARKADGCMLTALPSLTVTFLPEQAAVELTSDCGLDGTRRIACKGQADRNEMMHQLSCDNGNESSHEIDEEERPVSASSTTLGTPSGCSSSSSSAGGTESHQPPTRHRRDADDVSSMLLGTLRSTSTLIEETSINGTTTGAYVITSTVAITTTAEPLTTVSLTTNNDTPEEINITTQEFTAPVVASVVDGLTLTNTHDQHPSTTVDPSTMVETKIMPTQTFMTVIPHNASIATKEMMQKMIVGKPFNDQSIVKINQVDKDTMVTTGGSIHMSTTLVITSPTGSSTVVNAVETSVSSGVLNEVKEITTAFAEDNITKKYSEETKISDENLQTETFSSSMGVNVANKTINATASGSSTESASPSDENYIKPNNTTEGQVLTKMNTEDDGQTVEDFKEENRRRQFLPAPLRGLPHNGDNQTTEAGSTKSPSDWTSASDQQEDGEQLQTVETEPEIPARPNRGRRLTRPQGHSFYPYFLNRVLG